MNYKLLHINGHVEVRDSFGRFVLSADTTGEAYRELEELEKEKTRLNNQPSLLERENINNSHQIEVALRRKFIYRNSGCSNRPARLRSR